MVRSLYSQPSFGLMFGSVPDVVEGEPLGENATAQPAPRAGAPQDRLGKDNPQDNHEN